MELSAFSSSLQMISRRKKLLKNGRPVVRVKLKGINSISKRLADGTKVTYWYAWKGGPRIRDPRTPEGQVDYYEACATRVSGKLGVLETLVDGYLDSADFAQRAPRTKQDYRSKCKLIVERFGDMPLGALAARGARGEFMRWRDELARSSPRQADYAWSVLSRVLSWAVDRGDIEKIHANVADASTIAAVLKSSGLMRMKRRSWLKRHLSCSLHSCWPFGQAKGREICCDCHGVPTMANAFGSSNQKQRRT